MVDEILFREIALGGVGDDLWADKAVFLPIEAAFDDPPQDARGFIFEVGLKILVFFSSEKVTRNGARLNRRRCAASTFLRTGLLLLMMVS